jgi:hypothetical protein
MAKQTYLNAYTYDGECVATMKIKHFDATNVMTVLYDNDGNRFWLAEPIEALTICKYTGIVTIYYGLGNYIEITRR